MSNKSGTNLDQPGLKAGQRPIGYLFGQISALQEDPQIVSQRMKLKSNLVLRHALAGQPGPVDRLLAFLDVLLHRAALIVEPNDPVRLHRQVGGDEADAGKQLAWMPLDLGNNTAGFVPGRRLILYVAVDTLHAFWWASNRALEQMRDPDLRNAIGAKADGVEISSRFQRFIEVRDGDGGISPKEPHQVTIRVSRNDRLKNLFPAIRAVHIARPQRTPFEMAKLVKYEQRVITHAAEMTVPGGALLRPVGWTDLTVHVQRDPLGRYLCVNPVDPLP